MAHDWVVFVWTTTRIFISDLSFEEFYIAVKCWWGLIARIIIKKEFYCTKSHISILIFFLLENSHIRTRNFACSRLIWTTITPNRVEFLHVSMHNKIVNHNHGKCINTWTSYCIKKESLRCIIYCCQILHLLFAAM